MSLWEEFKVCATFNVAPSNRHGYQHGCRTEFQGLIMSVSVHGQGLSDQSVSMAHPWFKASFVMPFGGSCVLPHSTSV